MHNEWQKVLDFWFKESTNKQWFEKKPQFDAIIRDRFKLTTEKASRGELAHWRCSIKGRLAEIIVLDQFSRNIWRDTAKAFSQDNMALMLAQEAIKQPDYTHIPIKERKFILMPFMHSESPFIHQQAVPLFTALNDKITLEFEMRHKEIIDHFGRYPHRNGILNRVSTTEEILFLKKSGSSF